MTQQSETAGTQQQRPHLKTPNTPDDSMQDIVRGMLKYIETGDAKDLGKLGVYLGLIPESDADHDPVSSSSQELAPANANSNANTNVSNAKQPKQLQKPKNPVFKLPISYIPKYDQHPLSAALSDDLELLTAKDPASTRPLYDSLVLPNKDGATIYAKQYLYLWGETFTTNVEYLKNTQDFIARFCSQASKNGENKNQAGDEFKDVDEFWTTMKTNRVGFKDKFGYFDVPPLPIIERIEELNQVPIALQILSVYNVSTPVISLLMPVFLLILPFFIIKARGIDINVEKYFEVLKALASSHAVGKLFTEFSSVPVERKMYILMSVMFYFVQIYQNTMSCYRFYKNIYAIHDHLILAREYLKRTVVKMECVLRCCASLKYYTGFSGCLAAQLHKIRAVCEDLECVNPFSLSFDAITKIGYVMKHYYLFFKDAEVDDMMRYSFGFNAYYEHLCGIMHHIETGVLHPCTFISEGEQAAVTSMQDAYFLNTVASGSVVKNDITLDKKLIITGPNAAGKTTIIKTTLFNILLSQQLGYGVYNTATIAPYHFLHCYLNIPDTSGRDSLFQAESRRCKEILDCITEHASKRHFGIFDELYSGTNPYEAVASAYGYIDHISAMKNVDFMLTTHYISLCELFHPSSKKSKKSKNSKKSEKSESTTEQQEQQQGNANIRNLHMKTTVGESGTDHIYHYKVVNGISKVRGGIKVLVDLKYPDSIIQTTRRIINSKK
jgi:hypothetical protein